jgi:hypothetical protein
MTNGVLEYQWVLIQQDGKAIPRFDPFNGDIIKMPEEGVTGVKEIKLMPLRPDLVDKLATKKIAALSDPLLPVHTVKLKPGDTVTSYITEDIWQSSHYKCKECGYEFKINCKTCKDKTQCYFCPKCPRCGHTTTFYCSTCEMDITNPIRGSKKEPNCPNHTYPHGLNKNTGCRRIPEIKFIDKYIIAVKDENGHDKFKITVDGNNIITESL